MLIVHIDNQCAESKEPCDKPNKESHVYLLYEFIGWNPAAGYSLILAPFRNRSERWLDGDVFNTAARTLKPEVDGFEHHFAVESFFSHFFGEEHQIPTPAAEYVFHFLSP